MRIAVTVSGKVTYMATEHRIHTDQWNSKKRMVVNHENADLINVSLRRKVADIERDLIGRNLNGTPLTKNTITGKGQGDKLFASFAKEVREDQKEINRVTSFAGEGLLLSEINVAFLRRYEQHERRRGMAQNTINTGFKYLRRIINQAEAEKLIKENPFKSFDIPKYKQTDRVYLNKDELALMQSKVDDLTGSLRVTAYYFLLGCFSGLRHSDWGRFNKSMVHDGFLRISAKKNKKHIVLPIGISLDKIINVVKDMPRPASNQKCNVMLKAIASAMGINKELTTHAARHSFGYLCASNKIPKSVTAELMGINTQTVEVYYHLSGADIIQQAAVLKGL